MRVLRVMLAMRARCENGPVEARRHGLGGVALSMGLCIGMGLGLWGTASAQQGIYTCIDGKGRRITSDRPIIECLDRQQKELSSSGTVRRIVEPSLTGPERAALEQKEQVAAEIRARETEEKRKERALLLRYPNRTVHDKERNAALDQIDEVIKTSNLRSVQLAEQRAKIDAEYEFYSKNPAQAPGALKRRLDENLTSVLAQKRFVENQEVEKGRINQRFDEELVRLKELWVARGLPPNGVPASSPSTPRP